MTAELAVDRFLSLLGRSLLLSEEQMQQLLEEFAAPGSEFSDSGRLADELVTREVLTSWQAGMLLQGKHRGFILGPYRMLKPLGKGGMGTVFLAEHQMMRRQCAIKVLPFEHAKGDSSVLERFYREAQAVAALDHPNIVRAYDVNKAVDDRKEIHYLVMEYVEGQDLQKTVQQQGVLGYREAADMIRQVAEGLAHAHEAGLVHRDIKPANLLLDSKGVVKVLDLGLARFFSDAAEASLTKEFGDTVLGTADYLAPEQALDSHDVDARADIYSLGQTFYFLLTGHPPFPEGTVAQRLMAHQMKAPEPIATTRPDVPPGLVAIIDKMIAKKPPDRYQTAKEVADTLAEWLRGYAEGSGAFRRSSVFPRASQTAVTSRGEPTRGTSSHAEDTDLELAPLDEDEVKPPPSSTKLPSRKSDSQVAPSSGQPAASKAAPKSDATSAPRDSSPSKPSDEAELADSEKKETSGLAAALDDLPPLDTESLREDWDKDLLSGPLAAEAPAGPPLATPKGKKASQTQDQSIVAMVLDSGFLGIAVAAVGLAVVVGLAIAVMVSRPTAEETPQQPPATSTPDATSTAQPDSPAEKPKETATEKPEPAEAAKGPKPPGSSKPKQPQGRRRQQRAGAGGAPANRAGPQASSSPSPAEARSPGDAPRRKGQTGGRAAAGPKPPTERTAKPPQRTRQQGAQPPKPGPEAKSTADVKPPDTQALFAQLSKVSFRVKSVDPNPNSRLNLMLRHEALRSLERIEASPSEEDAAVLSLTLKATSANQLVRLVLSGELTCRVSDSKTVKVWQHERQVADIAPRVLREPSVHPAVRDGVSGFFDDFVEAHQKARDAVDARSRPASK